VSKRAQFGAQVPGIMAWDVLFAGFERIKGCDYHFPERPLTEGEVKFVRKRVLRRYWFWVGVLGASCYPSFYMLLSALVEAEWRFVIAVVGYISVVGVYLVSHILLVRTDLQSGMAQTVTGMLEARRLTYFHAMLLRIGRRAEIRVPREAFDRVKTGEVTTVAFLPRSHIALQVKRVNETTPLWVADASAAVKWMR